MIDWIRVLSITFTGLIVVFIALIILIFVIWIMGKISKSANKKEIKPTMVSKQQKSDIKNIDSKTVAAITAAISVYTDNKPTTIKFIAPDDEHNNRKPWSMAGLLKLTKPF